MECSSLPSVASQGETKRSLECLETGKASGILGPRIPGKNEKVRMNFLGCWAGLRVRMEDQQREREREKKKNGDGSGSQAWDRRIVKTNECRRSSCWSYTVPSFRSYTVLVFRTHLFLFFVGDSLTPELSRRPLPKGIIYNCSPVLAGLPLSPPSFAADAGPSDPLEREPLHHRRRGVAGG